MEKTETYNKNGTDTCSKREGCDNRVPSSAFLFFQKKGE